VDVNGVGNEMKWITIMIFGCGVKKLGGFP
jgi:hypothetical protein